MIAFLIWMKNKLPFLWRMVEWANGLLFRLRYRSLPREAAEVLAAQETGGCRFSLVEAADVPALARFLAAQPEERLVYFHPHAFDEKTLRRLQRNAAFLQMQVVAPDGRMAGYFFLRCFFIGRAFAGLIVDEAFQCQGIGTAIWATCAEICRRAGLAMQATISSDNQASMRSCEKGAGMQVVGQLDNGYVAMGYKDNNKQ